MRLWTCLSVVALMTACGGKTLPPLGYDTGDMARFFPDGATPSDLAGTQDLSVPPDLASTDIAGADMAQLQDIGFSDMPMEVTQSGGPVITLVSPLPTNDVVGNTLTVTVTVTGSQVQTVTLELPGDAAPAAMSLSNGKYSGSHDISQLGSAGEYTVVAKDLLGRTATLTAFFRHDAGPKITFIQPTAATVTGTLTVQVTVTDDLYPVINPANVHMTIGGKSFDLEHDDLGPNSFQILTDMGGGNPAGGPIGFYYTIDLNSFTPPLNGPEIINVTATNSKGTGASASKNFTVDNAGPIIVIDTPMQGNFIGGTVTISADIGDTPSGVDPNSVIAVVGGGTSEARQVPLTLVSGNATQGTYSAVFDARSLPVDANFITPQLSIQAKDTLGNFSEQDEFVVVDNQPPISSLNPGTMYVAQLESDGVTYECSQGFNPVGSDVPADGETVGQLFSLRARVEDQGNTATGQELVYVSGVDPTSVILYAIPGVADGMGNPPIIAVDSDGDGYCDKINPFLATVTGSSSSTSDTAIKVPLTTVTGEGTANFEYLTPQPGIYPRDCTVIGDVNVTTYPQVLCQDVGLPSDFTFALQYLNNTTPSIWTIKPIIMAQCAGSQFDSANYLPEGPACLVVAAQDLTENATISAPLRVCIDRGGGKCSSWTPPNCTGVVSTTTGKLVSGSTCTPRTYQNTAHDGENISRKLD